MPVVQTFEKTLDTDERLAALAAAMNRLPAEAVVRRLTAPDASPATVARVAPVDRPAATPELEPEFESTAQSTPPRTLTPTVRPVTENEPSPSSIGQQSPATAPRRHPEAHPAVAAGAGPTPNPATAIPALVAGPTSNPASATTAVSDFATVPAPAPATPAPATISHSPSSSLSLSISVPVPEPLAGLLPGGLRRGEAAALATKNQGPDFLALALLAESLKAGLWCAVIGVPELGLAALTGLLGSAAQRQAALDRLILVAEPGEQWAEITATLADGVDLLLTRPVTPVRAEIAQRVDARLRKGRSAGTRHSAALLVLGGWPTARLALRIARMDWTGLDGFGATAGTGHLTAGRATVVAQGRATAGRPRVARLWLPDATGAVRSLSDNPGTMNSTAAPSRPSQTGHDAPAAMEPVIAAPSLTLVPTASPHPALLPAATSPAPTPAPTSAPAPRSAAPISPASPAA
ncbi:MAG TPA: hypothetical protein VFU65_12375 [Actinocrinis sp.]|nr:hypothetical protein [Actinocrinis sp.]